MQLRCQSCGMPLGERKQSFWGSDSSGAPISEYCKLCFQMGQFTEPHLTMEEMMERSIQAMKKELGIPESQAVRLANDIIPRLKRWQRQNPYYPPA